MCRRKRKEKKTKKQRRNKGKGIRDECRKGLRSQFNQDLAVLVAFECGELVPFPAVTDMEIRDIRGGGQFP